MLYQHAKFVYGTYFIQKCASLRNKTCCIFHLLYALGKSFDCIHQAVKTKLQFCFLSPANVNFKEVLGPVFFLEVFFNSKELVKLNIIVQLEKKCQFFSPVRCTSDSFTHSFFHHLPQVADNKGLKKAEVFL